MSFADLTQSDASDIVRGEFTVTADSRSLLGHASGVGVPWKTGVPVLVDLNPDPVGSFDEVGERAPVLVYVSQEDVPTVAPQLHEFRFTDERTGRSRIVRVDRVVSGEGGMWSLYCA